MPHTRWNKVVLYVRKKRDPLSIGNCYAEGIHVKKDIETAIVFYKKAVSEGYFDAYVELGKLYEGKGAIDLAIRAYLEGALQDKQAAVDQLIRLAKTGNSAAKYYMGYICEKKGGWKQMAAWFREAAKSNDATWAPHALNDLVHAAHTQPEAAFQLAQMYESNEGHLKNPERTISFYLQASSLGHTRADFQLGNIYENGSGLPQNMENAFKWYAKASEANDPDAAFRLGELSQIDHGEIKADKEKAGQYYLQAARLGRRDALDPLERLAEEGSVQLQKQLGDLYKTLEITAEADRWYAMAGEGRLEEKIEKKEEKEKKIQSHQGSAAFYQPPKEKKEKEKMTKKTSQKKEQKNRKDKKAMYS